MEKKKIEIWIGFEIDANKDWEFNQSNIDTLLFAIKQGRYNTLTPRRIKIATDDPKATYTHEMT